MELDLSYPESITNFAKEVKNKFKTIYILVNNAGMFKKLI